MIRSDWRDTVYYAITVLSIFTVVLLVITYLLPPPDWENLNRVITPDTSSKEPAKQENTLIDSSETNDLDKLQAGYYIIVGSYKNITQAQQKAKELINDFNANIIVLPPVTEGYYRISFGKYSTREEANSAIKSIRTNVDSNAWIFSVKK